MGWRAIDKEGNETREDKDGRPVQAGEEGKLLVIAQEDYGHNIAVDLTKGIIFIDYDSLVVQNGSLEISGEKSQFWICDDTNIAGEMYHLRQEFVDFREEDGRKRIGEDGRFVKVRNDHLIPLTWRPIWFSRHSTTGPTIKIIGAQTTLPDIQGGGNVKKMVNLYADGRIGIS